MRRAADQARRRRTVKNRNALSAYMQSMGFFSKSRLRALATALCVSLAAGSAAAEPGELSRARLLSGWAEPDGARMAALLVELAPGWKTYWRNPGEAGVPPEFDWSASTNLAAAEISWPAPKVFEAFGMTTIGYSDRMLLPIKVTPSDPTKPIGLRLTLFYGVCEEVCLPATAELSLAIAPGAPPEDAAEIGAALGRAPAPAEAGGVKAASCEIGADRMVARLAYAAPPARAPLVVAEGPDNVAFGAFKARMDGDALVAEGEMRLSPGAWIDRAALRLFLLDHDGGPAYVVHGCPGA